MSLHAKYGVLIGLGLGLALFMSTPLLRERHGSGQPSSSDPVTKADLAFSRACAWRDAMEARCGTDARALWEAAIERAYHPRVSGEPGLAELIESLAARLARR